MSPRHNYKIMMTPHFHTNHYPETPLGKNEKKIELFCKKLKGKLTGKKEEK